MIAYVNEIGVEPKVEQAGEILDQQVSMCFHGDLLQGVTGLSVKCPPP